MIIKTTLYLTLLLPVILLADNAAIPTKYKGFLITPAVKQHLEKCARKKTTQEVEVQAWKRPCREDAWERCEKQLGNCSNEEEGPHKTACMSGLYRCRKQAQQQVLSCQRSRSRKRKEFDRKYFEECKELYKNARGQVNPED